MTIHGSRPMIAGYNDKQSAMTTSQITLTAIVFLLTSISLRDVSLADDHSRDAATTESPQAVVARWLELHRTGKRDVASALTTGTFDRRAELLLPSTRDTGVRVVRSLGNKRAAAVVTGPLDDAGDGERVLLFWLVRRDGVWRINKSDVQKRQVVDERLLGFLEAGDVRWHLQRDQLVGHWEAGPCTPPGGDGLACGSRFQLGDDNRYQLLAWGPVGPDPGHDDVMQGEWRLAGDKILLSHQDRTYECPVTWMGNNQLEIESADGKVRAVYERADAAQDRPDAVEGELDRK